MIRTPGADLDRIQTPHVRDDDEAEASLRPRRLDEFVGQQALKAQLEVSIKAAAARGEALDHVLLAGPPGPRQDQPGPDHRRGARRPVRADRRPGAGAQGRHRRVPDRPRAARGVLRRRDPPPAARGGGDVLSGDGGRPAADHVRRRRGREGRHAADPAVHADRRDHPRRPADDAAARPLRHPAPAGPLRRRRAGRDRRPQRPRAQRRRAHGRRAGDRRALPRHAARGQPAAQARARLRAGPRRRHRRRRDRLRRAGRDGRRPRGPGPAGPRDPARRSASGSAGGPVGLSTLAVAVHEEQDTIEDVYEPYLLQRGFIMRTPRGRCATPHAFRHLGLEPPREPAGLF